MRREVKDAADFLSNILRKRNISDESLDTFHHSLQLVLCSHYHNHWFPEKPFKGSGYRCLRIVNQKMDPLIARAGAEAGFSESELLSLFPSELTLWIDPEEVSYRIGEDGSVGIVDSSDTEDSGIDSEESTRDSVDSSNSDSDTQEYLDCKEQLRYYIPGATTTTSQEAMNWEYLAATFVAS